MMSRRLIAGILRNLAARLDSLPHVFITSIARQRGHVTLAIVDEVHVHDAGELAHCFIPERHKQRRRT